MQNSKNQKYLKAGLGYTVGNYLLKGLSFFTIPIFARLLTEEEYGYYNLFMTYVSIITIIIGLALSASYKNAKFRSEFDYKKYISNSITIILLNSVFICLVMCFVRSLFKDLTNNYSYIVIVLAFYSMSSAIITCYNSALGLEYKYKPYLIIAFINAISSIAISLLLIYTPIVSDNAIARIIGGFVPEILITIYIVFYFFRESPPILDWSFTRFALSFSLPLVAHGLSQIILNSFDRIMISNMVGLKENGIYSFSYNIFSILQVTSTSLIVVWETWFYQQMGDEAYKKIRKYGNILIMLFALCSCGVLLLSPEIILLLGGDKYRDAIFTVIPIIIGGYFTMVYCFPAEIEYYFEKTKFIAIATIIAAALNILLNWLFIPIYGYVAAAYTTLFTYAVYFCFHFIISRRILKEKLYPLSWILGNVIIVAASGIMSFTLRNNWVARWTLAFMLVMVFGLILCKKGIINEVIKGKDKHGEE